MKKTVLFLCTGNYYRSRFAEVFFNHLTNEHRWQAVSRGLRITNKNEGMLSPAVAKQLDRFGIEISPKCLRRPLPVTQADIDSADLVIAVDEEEHRRMIEIELPLNTRQIKFWSVPDVPYVRPEIGMRMLTRNVWELVKMLPIDN